MLPEIGLIIQKEVRKKKRPVLMFVQEESETWISNLWKQIWKVYILGIRYGH